MMSRATFLTMLDGLTTEAKPVGIAFRECKDPAFGAAGIGMAVAANGKGKVLFRGNVGRLSAFLTGYLACFDAANPGVLETEQKLAAGKNVLWIFRWKSGGYNTVSAPTQEEALEAAGKLGRGEFVTLVPLVSTLRPYRAVPGDKYGRDAIEIDCASMID